MIRDVRDERKRSRAREGRSGAATPEDYQKRHHGLLGRGEMLIKPYRSLSHKFGMYAKLTWVRSWPHARHVP
jgi:hypothetical protein